MEKKILGKNSENLVDTYMSKWKWTAVVKNDFFRGGEIDRLYRCEHFTSNHFGDWCAVEVKGRSFDTADDIRRFLESELFWQELLKKKQLQNLFRYSQRLSLQNNTRVHIRLFFVCWSRSADIDEKNTSFLKSRRFKFIRARNYSRSSILLSVIPEFVRRGEKTSILQIEI